MERLTIDEAIKKYHKLSNSDKTCYPKEAQQITKWLEELKQYKDAEEQGLLFKLPCKVGDIAYSITRNFISEYTICSIEKYKEGFFFNWRCEKGIYINARGFTNYDIGKTVFLTREAAEQALKKMESEG